MRDHLRTHESSKAVEDGGSGTISSKGGVALETSNQDFPGMEELQVVDSVPTVTMATERELKQISDVIATHSLHTVSPHADQEAEFDEVKHER